MEYRLELPQLSIVELNNLFTETSSSGLCLNTKFGKGSLQIYDLEKGLQVKFWNCMFSNEIELHTSENTNEREYFTLAFLRISNDTQSLDNGGNSLTNTSWYQIFISSSSNFQLRVSPLKEYSCISISFSSKWLHENLFNANKEFTNLSVRLSDQPNLLMQEVMDATETKPLQELLSGSWKNGLGSFYIRSEVLKIVSDFFYKIKDREGLGASETSMAYIIQQVEKNLNNSLLDSLPNLKTLCSKFATSESTIKRHFKKKHGINMSAYFLNKKMEYAKQLINTNNS